MPEQRGEIEFTGTCAGPYDSILSLLRLLGNVAHEYLLPENQRVSGAAGKNADFLNYN